MILDLSPSELGHTLHPRAEKEDLNSVYADLTQRADQRAEEQERSFLNVLEADRKAHEAKRKSLYDALSDAIK